MDQALDYYIKAETYFLYFSRKANVEARRLHAAAIAIKPDFTRAHADLAYSMLHAWLFGWDDSVTLDAIRHRAGAALQHDSSDFYAQQVMGDVLLYCREFDLARDTYAYARDLAKKQAIPEDILSIEADWADLLLLTGKASDAIGVMKKVIEDSRVPERWFHWVLGWAYYQNGQYDESLAALFALKNPRNAIRKNVVASYAARAEIEQDPGKAKQFLDKAKEHAKAFLDEEKDQGTYYGLAGEPVLERLLQVEDRIPFEKDTDSGRWKHHLKLGFEGVTQP
jgi:hypothetical protein